MDNLNVAPRRGRNRALSVNTYSQEQQNTMSGSLNNLENDLNFVSSKWHRVISSDSNPLELALRFLDDTSVGLGHRYPEFNQLKMKIGSDLQLAVNEHYQAFNSNIASYSVAVDAITEAQNNISTLKRSVHDANSKITSEKGTLQEVNDKKMEHSKMLDILSAIEEILLIPEKVDEQLRKDRYNAAQKLLAHSFQLANTYSLWSMPSLLPFKQQLEVSEHNLFQNIIGEIHDIVYSKKSVDIVKDEIMDQIGSTENDFTSLENYIYNVISVDIVQQSEDMNTKLEKFMKKIKQLNLVTKRNEVHIDEDSEYDQLFNLLALVSDMDKLPLALKILLDRAKTELHAIVIENCELLHNKHPSLFKMPTSVSIDNEFGLSMTNMVSVVMRELFWRVFIRFLLSIQRHKVIYECVLALQPITSTTITYRFDKIWKKWICEIESLLNNYLNDPSITANKVNRIRNNTTSSAAEHISYPVFSLQSNLEGGTVAKADTNELKLLLKEIFPGFTVPGNINLSSIYVEEESFEEEKPLISPSVFNMKIILEPLLLFIQATSRIVSEDVSKNSQSSTQFFLSYMTTKFFPRLELTVNSLFDTKILSNNSFAFDLNEENQNIFKSAIEFKNLFFNLLFVLHTTYTYRKMICATIIDLLGKFQSYYHEVFSELLTFYEEDDNRKLIATWLNDSEIMTPTSNFLQSSSTALPANEASLFFKQYPNFYVKGKNLHRDDFLNSVDLDAVLHFLNSVLWILEWLPNLRKRIDVSDDEKQIDADKLRADWSLYESAELSTTIKDSTLRLSMDDESLNKFDAIVNEFKALKYSLLATLRFDTRARCIYYIGRLFQTNKNWNPDVGSTELDPNISSLISSIRMFESKLKSNLPESLRDKIFEEIDQVNNFAFLAGANSIKLINQNGIKKMLRNITFLQNLYRNVVGDSSKINMNPALKFYSTCGLTENELFEMIDRKELEFCSSSDLKNILRLIYDDTSTKQPSQTSKHTRTASIPGNKRYTEAIQRIDNMMLSN